MKQQIIACRGLYLKYGGNVVLEDINLSVHTGEIIGLMGPNGSGKTSLIKTMLGSLSPSGGSVDLFGCRCDKLFCHHRSRIGYLPQKPTIDTNYPLTVLEATLMGRYSALGLFKRPGKKDYAICRQMLEHTGMDSYIDRPIGELSGGQQQRVFIARALTQNPCILLLDEPTTGLDVPAQTRLIDTIRALHKRLGLAIVFVTHEINLISSFVDKVVLLNKKIYASGSPGEILTKEHLSKIYGSNIHISRKDDGHYVFTGDHHV